MKNKLQLLWLLLPVLIIAGTFTAAFGSLLPLRDQVEVTQTVLLGDPSAAEGLLAEYKADYDRHLFWTIAVRPGPEPASETDYVYTQVKHDENSTDDSTFVFSISEFNAEDTYPEDQIPSDLLPDFQRLETKTPAGKERSMELDMKQYFKFYPVDLYMQKGLLQVTAAATEADHGQRNTPGTKEYVSSKLNDYFRIPVADGEKMILKVDKTNGSSNVYHRYFGRQFTMSTYAAATSDAIYFTFNTFAGEGKIVDTSLIPGGYGIYRLPIGQSTGSGKAPENISASDLLIDELSNVLPLNPSVNICDLRLDSREKRLFLYTLEENDDYWLTVLDLDTMEVLQKLNLSCESEVYTWPWCQADDFLVFSTEQTLLLFTAGEDGRFEKEFEIPLPSEEDALFYLDTEGSFVWDGKRLAFSAACPSDLNGRNWNQLGFRLAVCDASGLLYCGEYMSLLNPTDTPGNISYLCRPTDRYLPKLHWEVKS